MAKVENQIDPPQIGEPSLETPKLQQNGVHYTCDTPKSFFKVEKLSENAVLPSRASSLSAGYDLSSATEAKVPARGKSLVPTDLSIAVPEGTYARKGARFSEKNQNDHSSKLDYITRHLHNMKHESVATPTASEVASYLRPIGPNGNCFPPGFMIPPFIKFNGKGNPEGHIKHFVRMMNNTPLNTQQAASLFDFSLEGNALQWYGNLSFYVQENWHELVACFFKQYEINTLQSYTLSDLTALRQDVGERFDSYYENRWLPIVRKLSVKPIESDLIEFLANGALPHIREVIKFQMFKTFSDLFQMVRKIERHAESEGKDLIWKD